MRRRKQRVLEVDHRNGVVVDHQIPAMIIAMVKTDGLAVQSSGNFFKDFSERCYRAWGDGEVRPLLQTVFEKMFELPHVKPKIEALLKGETRVITLLGTADLQHQQLVYRLSVPSENFTFRLKR